MNRAILKKIVYLAIALSFVGLMIGCSLKSDEEAIIGKWAYAYVIEAYNFTSDGNVIIAGTIPGTWTMDTGAKHLTITPTGGSSTTYDYSFSSDKNTLTLDSGSGAMTFTRM